MCLEGFYPKQISNIFNQKGAFNADFRAVQLSGRSVTTYTEANCTTPGGCKDQGACCQIDTYLRYGQRERETGA